MVQGEFLKDKDQGPGISDDEASIGSKYDFRRWHNSINTRQAAIPRIGTTGTNGQRNGRAASGLVRRIISTAPQTMTKANKVPILVRCSKASIGRNAVMVATNTPMRIVLIHGVLKVG